MTNFSLLSSSNFPPSLSLHYPQVDHSFSLNHPLPFAAFHLSSAFPHWASSSCPFLDSKVSYFAYKDHLATFYVFIATRLWLLEMWLSYSEQNFTDVVKHFFIRVLYLGLINYHKKLSVRCSIFTAIWFFTEGILDLSIFSSSLLVLSLNPSTFPWTWITPPRAPSSIFIIFRLIPFFYCIFPIYPIFPSTSFPVLVHNTPDSLSTRIPSSKSTPSALYSPSSKIQSILLAFSRFPHWQLILNSQIFPIFWHSFSQSVISLWWFHYKCWWDGYFVYGVNDFVGREWVFVFWVILFRGGGAW